MVPDVGLGHAHQLVGLLGAAVHGVCRRAGGGQGSLGPQLEIGEAVLERLVRGQGAAEREAIEGVLDRHGQDAVDRPHHGGALQRHRQLEQPLDLVRRAAHGAQHRIGPHGHVVEVDEGEPVRQVDRLGRDDRHPRRVGLDEELGGLAADQRGHHKQVGLGRRLGRALPAGEDEPFPFGDRLEGDPIGGTGGTHLPQAPGGDGLAGEDPRQMARLLFGRAVLGERGRHQVGRKERPGGHPPPHLLRHQGQIQQAMTRDAAPAVRLGHQQRGPSERRRPAATRRRGSPPAPSRTTPAPSRWGRSALRNWPSSPGRAPGHPSAPRPLACSSFPHRGHVRGANRRRRSRRAHTPRKTLR